MDRSLAYIDDGNLWTLDIPGGRAVQWTHFTNATAQELSFSPGNSKYLFTLREGGKTGSICEVSGRSAELTRHAGQDRSDAKWVQGGSGIASIRSLSNATSLVVETSAGDLRTNLFENARMQGYAVSGSGGKIFAVAHDQFEMFRLWEYDLATGRLRKLVKPKKDIAHRIVAPAIRSSTTNALGKKVDYYFVKPVRLRSDRKYPAVLDMNSANRFDHNVQMVANAGIFYVSANRFGVREWSVVPNYEDALAVYREVIKDPNVDSNRVYVAGLSISTGLASRLVNDHPELWRGVLLISPISWPRISPGPAGFPSLFISIGIDDDEDRKKASERAMLEASRHGIPARINYQYERAGHAYRAQHFEKCYKAMARFILTDY